MHVHVLGVCGTFMAGLAALARALGDRVTGSDAQAYPPMSDQLARLGIEVLPGYDPAHLDPAPDVVVVGNALTRGNPVVEHLLEGDLAFTSGPAWLAERVLRGRHVIAVAGTHGKTTTSTMLAWILADAGREPGWLIGGVPIGLEGSARLGRIGPDGSRAKAPAPFVVEADEYDTAFFDKRSKFVHYRPRTLVLNNLEYDHADIFDDLSDIRRQFHHVVRTVPASGRIVSRAGDAELERVLDMGCWTPVERFGREADDGRIPPQAGRWGIAPGTADASRFAVLRDGDEIATVEWGLAGEHNALNGVAAIAAAAHAGVDPAAACGALARFPGVKRRLEVRGVAGGVTVYDDFAHHPTAIRATLGALRARVGAARIVAVLDPASNTMRLGVHRDTLGPSLADADAAIVYRAPASRWDVAALAAGDGVRVLDDVDAIVAACREDAREGDHLLVMSNGAFGGIHERLLAALEAR